MASPIDPIQTRLRAILRAMRTDRNQPVFREVTGYENGIRPMPQAQLYFMGATPQAPSTGNLQDIGWNFALEMFWGGPVKDSVDQIEDFYAAWPKTVLQNQALGVGGALKWDWEERAEPALAADGDYMTAVIQITVTTEEGD